MRGPGRRGSTLDLLVLGAGVSGLTAAWHAAQRGLSVGLLERDLPGGLVVNVGALEGYPSERPTSGAGLATGLVDALDRLGVALHREEVRTVEPGTESGSATTVNGSVYRSRRIVLALGARLRRLDVPGFDTLWGRGVSQCAFCDAGLYRARPVVVVGGGDAALQEALHLAEAGCTVTLVHRGRRLRARREFIERAGRSERIEFRWRTVVTAIRGGDAVEGVTVRRLDDGVEAQLSCSAIFPFVGLEPCSEVVRASVACDGAGAVTVDERMRTSMPNVYAVGAVRSGYPGQLTSAVGDATGVALALAEEIG